MQISRFCYHQTDAGWQSKIDDPSLQDQLDVIFSTTIGLQDLPEDLTVVGHCPLEERWCVFVKEAGQRDLDGLIIESEVYARHDHDPFVAAAEMLESRSTERMIASGTHTAPEKPLGKDLLLAAGPKYLGQAYSFFLAAAPEERCTFYVSVLPQGRPPRLSPLTCFTTATVARPPTVAETQIGLPGELNLGEGVQPLPGVDPAPAMPAPPPSVDPTPAMPTPPPSVDPAPATPTPPPAAARQIQQAMPDRTGGLVFSPDQDEAPQDRPASSDVPGTDGDWSALPLSRTEDEGAAPAGSEPEAGDAEASKLRQLELRLEEAEANLRLRTRFLGGAVVAVLLLAGFSLWVVADHLQSAISEVDEAKVSRQAIADGLNVKAGERSIHEAIAAKLSDLSTVTLQSGAWQAGLRSRGVKPEEFLDHLVELAAERRTLIQLVGQETALLQLARKNAALLELARGQSRLTTLVPHAPALGELAQVQETLAGLVAQEPGLLALAANQEQIAELVARRQELIAIAGQRAAIDDLLAYAPTIRSTLTEVGNLLFFMERWQGSLQELASNRAALSELARHREKLSELAGQKEVLDRLVRDSQALTELAGNSQLRTLAARRQELAELTANLNSLAELSRNSAALLALLNPVPGG